MKVQKNSILIGFASVVVLTLVFLFSDTFCKPTHALCQALHVTESRNMTPVEISPGYVEYSATGVAEALAANKKVFLYFWAPWCTSCSSLDIEIENDPSIIPTTSTVFQVKYDQDVTLKQRYGVTIQHTFVEIDAEGNLTKHWVGGNAEELRQRLK